MFITAAEVRDRAALPDVKNMTDAEIDNWIIRADGWIRRATHRTFSDNPPDHIQQDLGTATVLLVEYLAIKNDPEIREQEITNVERERIGGYTYQINSDAKPGQQTNIAELDSILESLAYKPAAGNIFRVSGPRG